MPTYLGTYFGSTGSSLSEGLTYTSQIRGDALLCSHKPWPKSWSRGKALPWSCHVRLPRGCPSSFPGSPVWVLWQFFLPRRNGSYREQLQAAQLCQRCLPLHGRTRFAPSQREGRGTQHAPTVEEALSQLPTVLEQREGLAFISSYEECIAPALSSSHKTHAQAQLCCK